MNEVVIRAVILLMVFVLAGYLISRATKGLIRLVVIAVLTGLFLVAARSMFNQIMESRAANSVPQTPPPQVNVTVSPTAIASPTVSPSVVVTPEATTDSKTPLYARSGMKNIPFIEPFAAFNNGQSATAAPASTPQDYQPDYQTSPNQQPAAQRPTNQQPITGGW
ncbi:MAG: hypothetical protein SFY66_05035 [Oculatellaceae cyanobacterium bins.114]|nr:hypothetical protein [Oculatellaceae cyanobacterium bins.114]